MFARLSVMKLLALGLVLIAGSAVDAAPLPKVTGGNLEGLSLAQVIGTVKGLGLWRLNSGGQVRLESVLTRNGGDCEANGLDSADQCPRYTLLVSVNGETSVPVHFALFRGPETLGWIVPKDAKTTTDGGKLSIPLCAREMKKTPAGYGWQGTSYVLRIGEDLQTLSDGFGHFAFTADLDKLVGGRPDCAN